MTSTQCQTSTISLLRSYTITLHTIWLVHQPRMFRSPVLTFFSDIACYLTRRPNDQLLQHQSCSAQWPHYKKDTQSLTAKPLPNHTIYELNRLLIHAFTHNRFVIYFILDIIRPLHLFHSHARLCLKYFRYFFDITFRRHTHILFIVRNTCIIINTHTSIYLDLLVYSICTTLSRSSRTHDHSTHNQRCCTVLTVTAVQFVTDLITLHTTPHNITNRWYDDLCTHLFHWTSQHHYYAFISITHFIDTLQTTQLNHVTLLPTHFLH